MDGLFARGGAVELGVSVPWSLQQGFDYLTRLGLSENEVRARATAMMDEWDRLDDDGYWSLPVSDISALRRHAVRELGGISVLDDASVAARCRVADSYDRVEAATFHIAGWHDIFIQGTLDNYREMAARGLDSRLIVGPWTHPTHVDPIGDELYGIRASREGVPIHPFGDVNDFQLAWLRHHLVPDSGISLPDTPVRIFVMGRNEWRDEPAWPLARAVDQQWFLHPDRSLLPRSPRTGAAATEFAYDPADPVPTVGGHTVMWSGYPAGPIDQRLVEERPDVLVFTSPPLTADLEVTGRVRVVLHAESSAPSTDWVARLCDVGPDGASVNLCDGILRVHEQANERQPVEIDLWSTSNVFLPGHRLRVHVTSSSFPRWDRNLNTGNQRSPRVEVARQRVYHDDEHPSYIELPVVD